MKTNFINCLQRDTYIELDKASLPDPGKDTADYIDRHIVAAMIEIAKTIPSDEEIKARARGYSDYAHGQAAFIRGANYMKEQILKK